MNKYIENGWSNYRRMFLKDAPEEKVNELRQAYFSGAAVLFTTLMAFLDPGLEETESDMKKMADLQEEIDRFGMSLDRKFLGNVEH